MSYIKAIITILSIMILNPLITMESGHPDTGKTEKQATVRIKLFSFTPEQLTVTSGTKIVWINHDQIEHSVTHGEPGNKGSEFNSGFFTKGEKYEFLPDKPGRYPYFCERHESMKGEIIVVPERNN